MSESTLGQHREVAHWWLSFGRGSGHAGSCLRASLRVGPAPPPPAPPRKYNKRATGGGGGKKKLNSGTQQEKKININFQNGN